MKADPLEELAKAMLREWFPGIDEAECQHLLRHPDGSPHKDGLMAVAARAACKHLGIDPEKLADIDLPKARRLAVDLRNLVDWEPGAKSDARLDDLLRALGGESE